MVDITEVCNLGCIHCAHQNLKLVLLIISECYENLNKKMVDEVANIKNITKYIRYTMENL